MWKEIILWSHAVFGTLGVIAAVWLFVEVLNISESNKVRIKYVSIPVVVLMWLSYMLGGYWYVTFYPADRAIILAGPWKWAHQFFMEVKEHLFFMILLLSTYLPIAVYNSDLLSDKGARKMILGVAGLIALLGLVMDAFGAVIIMGVKIGLMH
jgi:predicted membrane channel-forming protein YqfA (hemolysin III family)